ncbi:MAG: roadblock/LC7 domain-containing protein [Acidithiobacillus ferrooxidans]
MNQDMFDDLNAQLDAMSPEIQGAALISNEGAVIFQKGETIADQRLIGIAGAAIMRLAEHISSGLAECPAQEISIRCDRHTALFMPVGADALLMLVLSADTDTRPLARAIPGMVSALGQRAVS